MEKIEVTCEFVHQTAKGLLVKVGDDEVWLPKSQLELVSGTDEKGSELVLLVPDWLAQDKGLV